MEGGRLKGGRLIEVLLRDGRKTVKTTFLKQTKPKQLTTTTATTKITRTHKPENSIRVPRMNDCYSHFHEGKINLIYRTIRITNEEIR